MDLEVQPNWTHCFPPRPCVRILCFFFHQLLFQKDLFFPVLQAWIQPMLPDSVQKPHHLSLLCILGGLFSALLLTFLLVLSYLFIWPIPFKILNSWIFITLIVQVPLPPKPLANAWEMIDLLNPGRKMVMVSGFTAVIVMGLWGGSWWQWWKVANESFPWATPLLALILQFRNKLSCCCFGREMKMPGRYRQPNNMALLDKSQPSRPFLPVNKWRNVLWGNTTKHISR